MIKAKRYHANLKDIPAGAIVMLNMPGFAPGHIAIFSGKYAANGTDPLLISTGAPTTGSSSKNMSGLHLVPLSTYEHPPFNGKFMGWADAGSK